MVEMKLDASNDRSFAQLYTFRQFYGPFPDYVKQASVEESLTPVGLLPSAFADVVGQQLPCHTKAACYLSTIYFLENRHRADDQTVARIANRLEKSAAEHGILSDITNLVNRERELKQADSEDALPDSSFALVKGAGDTKERSYPLRNGNEVVAAAQWFNQYRDHFKFADRQTMAERILDKAAEFSVTFPERLDLMLDKQAGRGVYNPPEVVRQLKFRASMPEAGPELKGIMLKLAATVLNEPHLAEDPSAVCEMASAIDSVDRLFGWNRKYSDTVKRPEDIFFAGSLKYAASFLKSAQPTATGTVYEHDQLQNLSFEQLSDLFGTKIASEARFKPGKVASLVANLPLKQAVRFDRYMQSIGEVPRLTKASAAQLSPDERAAIAREYTVEQLAKEAAETSPALVPTGSKA